MISMKQRKMMERIARKIINPALISAGEIAAQMAYIASKMGGSGTFWGGTGASTGGMGTSEGGNLNAKCVRKGGSATRAVTHITADGTQMCVGTKGLVAGIVQKFCHIATLWCGCGGIRALPDKCVCDTNAYLARNYKNYWHLYGSQMLLRQEGCTYFTARRLCVFKRGLAYE